MVLREKKFVAGKENVLVTLEKTESGFTVKINGAVYYSSPNEMFATQRFISI